MNSINRRASVEFTHTHTRALFYFSVSHNTFASYMPIMTKSWYLEAFALQCRWWTAETVSVQSGFPGEHTMLLWRLGASTGRKNDFFFYCVSISYILKWWKIADLMLKCRLLKLFGVARLSRYSRSIMNWLCDSSPLIILLSSSSSLFQSIPDITFCDTFMSIRFITRYFNDFTFLTIGWCG